MKSYVEESGFFGKENPEELALKYGTPLYVYNEDNLRYFIKQGVEFITTNEPELLQKLLKE